MRDEYAYLSVRNIQQQTPTTGSPSLNSDALFCPNPTAPSPLHMVSLRYEGRRVSAQTLAAAAFRGHLARADSRRDWQRTKGAGGYIARRWWKFMLVRHRAATKIQAIWRGILGRQNHQQLLVAVSCTIRLQSLVSKRNLFIARWMEVRLLVVPKGVRLDDTSPARQR